MSSQVDHFVGLLQEYRSNGSVSNPWADWDREYDTNKHAPSQMGNPVEGERDSGGKLNAIPL
jgi:hypothetical protein